MLKEKEYINLADEIVNLFTGKNLREIIFEDDQSFLNLESDRSVKEEVLQRLKREGIIESPGKMAISLTDKGYEIRNAGGYKAFKLQEEQAKMSEDYVRKLEFQKLELEIDNLRNQTKYNWVPYVLSLLAILISLFDLLFR